MGCRSAARSGGDPLHTGSWAASAKGQGDKEVPEGTSEDLPDLVEGGPTARSVHALGSGGQHVVCKVSSAPGAQPPADRVDDTTLARRRRWESGRLYLRVESRSHCSTAAGCLHTGAK